MATRDPPAVANANAPAVATKPATASTAAPPARAIPAVTRPSDFIFDGLKALVLPADSRKSIVVAQNAPPEPAAASAAPAPTVPLALQAPDPGPEVDNDTPFAFADFTWLNGNPRNHAPAFDTRFFTPDIRMDAYYTNDFEHPVDHTISGSTEEFRSGEFQLEQVSFGGDFHWDNVRARFLSMMGMFATTIPRDDAPRSRC